MPNRIIKESIHTSKKVSALSDFQFRLWTYLLVYVDDYGRGMADPAIVHGRCMARLKGRTIKDVGDALKKLADMGCILLYEIDGESYLCFPNWDKHQTIRNKRSNFPPPPAAETLSDASGSQSSAIGNMETAKTCNQLQSIAINCNQTKSIASLIQSNPKQSNPNPNPNPNPITIVRSGEPETEIERMFEKFWALYPLHKSKAKALSEFQMLHPTAALFETIIGAIVSQKQWRRWREGYIPNPANWLRERRWEDEREPEITTPAAAQLSGQREYNEDQLRDTLGVSDLFREEVVSG